MCGGSSGPSADQIYSGYTDEGGKQVAGIKPTFGALPSLSMTGKVERSGAQYGSARTGSKRRSLLAPMMQMTLDQGAQ
jgi:hypothetical protein